MVEPLSIRRADARRLVNGGEETLVLETWSVERGAWSVVIGLLTFAGDERNPGVAGAVQDGALLRRVEIVERHVQREACMARQCLGEAQEGRVLFEIGPGGE